MVSPARDNLHPYGIIRLGAVIKDFERQTLILLEPDADTDTEINLPRQNRDLRDRNKDYLGWANEDPGDLSESWLNTPGKI